MSQSSKTARQSHVKSGESRSHKRRDASALHRIPLQRCAYAKCPVWFTPTRADKKYHSPGCRKADWFEKHFVQVTGAAAGPPVSRTSCSVCKTPKTDWGGIDLNELGWFCYRCVKWVHRVADQTVALHDNPAAKLETEQES
jgi:hypothetical protein